MKPKILITIDWFLPGTMSGGPARSYANLIAHLQDDFEFYIVTRNTDYGSSLPYENITPNSWIDFENNIKIYYISDSKLNSQHLKEIFQSISFDIVYINGIYSWYFSILPIILLRKIKKTIIISARGMLNSQAFSVKGTKKKIFLSIAKILKLYNNVKFHATNIDEAQSIKNEIGSSVSVLIAPNLPRKQNPNLVARAVKSHPVKFVNLARISPEKGTLKMLASLKYLKLKLILDIYGPIHDQNYWNKCLMVIASLPNHIQVTYKGILDGEDVPHALLKYDFFVLLSEGENFGHAILEALSVGLPVIISDKTPWKNLESKMIGWDVSIDSKNEIMESFLKAVEMTNEDYTIWSSAALQYAKTFIENPDHLEQNRALFLV